MANELILINKIEKRLQEKKEPAIFPLTPTHRKELRQLRDDNIGNLRDRLSTIRTLKREEYEKKYSDEIIKELEKYELTAKKLNADWKERIIKINKILKERKNIEEKADITKLNLNNDYGNLADLEAIKNIREFTLKRKDKSLEIAREEFDKKYGDSFTAVEKKIDAIVTHYEEAINFGDLEIVKKIYYMMKKSDNFFTKISNLKI